MASDSLLQPFVKSDASSGDGDLFSALNMFTNGLQSFQLSRTLSGANDQIQQIRDSAMKDDEKRSAMSQVAQGLTMHMLQYGSPAEAVQQMQKAVMPKEAPLIQSGIEAYTMGTPAQRQGAADYQKMLTDEKIRADQATMDNTPPDPTKGLMQDTRRAALIDTHMSKLRTAANAAENSTRKPLGQLLTRIQQAGGIEQLMTKDPAQTSRVETHEIAGTMGRLFNGGNVPNQEELNSIIPLSYQTKLAHLQEMAGNPAAMNTPEYINLYHDIVNRMQDVAEAQRKAEVKKIFRGSTSAAKVSADDFKSTAQALTGETPEIVNGQIVFPSDREEDALAGNIKKVLEKKNDQMAMRAFMNMEKDPNFITLQQRPEYSNLAGKIRMYRAQIAKSGGRK